jgi:hypothetical protein
LICMVDSRLIGLIGGYCVFPLEVVLVLHVKTIYLSLYNQVFYTFHYLLYNIYTLCIQLIFIPILPLQSISACLLEL